MHELALIQSIVAAVEERVQPARVDVVRLEIGQLAGVSEQALRFCFDVCTRGTSLEGAVLEIEGVAGAGEDMRIRNVEVH